MTSLAALTNTDPVTTFVDTHTSIMLKQIVFLSRTFPKFKRKFCLQQKGSFSSPPSHIQEVTTSPATKDRPSNLGTGQVFLFTECNNSFSL